MNKYELTVILEGKTTSAKKKAVLESIEKTIKLLEGKVQQAEDWGIKDLFHKMKKNNQGVFLHMILELSASSLKQLDLKLKMNDNIVRYLIIKK